MSGAVCGEYRVCVENTVIIRRAVKNRLESLLWNNQESSMGIIKNRRSARCVGPARPMPRAGALPPPPTPPAPNLARSQEGGRWGGREWVDSDHARPVLRGKLQWWRSRLCQLGKEQRQDSASGYGQENVEHYIRNRFKVQHGSALSSRKCTWWRTSSPVERADSSLHAKCTCILDLQVVSCFGNRCGHKSYSNAE